MNAIWRDYEPRDYEAVVLLHEQLQKRVGRDFDLPNPGKRPVLICQVREVDGVITHAVFGEAEMEIGVVGEAPIPAAEFGPAVHRLHEVAMRFRLRIARAFVPKQLLDKPNGKPAAIRRILESGTVQFTEDKGNLIPFFYWIPQVEETAEEAA